MKKFNDGDLTVIAIDKNYEIDYKSEEVFKDGLNYIDELSKSNFFFDRLKSYILTNKEYLLFNGDLNNQNDIFKFVKYCYADAGVKGDKKNGAFSYNPGVIEKWIKGNIPSPRSREEIFRFCLCIKMNEEQVTEFILKGCLTKPFNFKNISESVYYFCFNNGKSYKDYVRIMEKIESSEYKENQFPENDTVKIGESIHNIQDEEKLIDYLTFNKAGFSKQNQTALSLLTELVENSVDFAEWERGLLPSDYGISEIKSKQDIAAILNIILGFEARANEKGKDVYKKKIADSNFPKLIKENFPQPQQIQNLLKSGVGSPEMIRKTIILFTFYNMFSELKKNKLDYSDGKYFNGFADEVDTILAQCGYIQMYWRHPYDWMFGFCASTDEPLDALREIISICYTDVDDFYTEK